MKPFERVTKITLSVLAKSAAAALIRFKRIEIPAVWRILAVPFFGDEPERMFEPMFKEHIRIEENVDLWVGQTDKGSWVAAYRYQNLAALFLFDLQMREAAKYARLRAFNDADVLYFEGAQLLGLAGHPWPEYPRRRRPKFPIPLAWTVHLVHLGRWRKVEPEDASG